MEICIQLRVLLVVGVFAARASSSNWSSGWGTGREIDFMKFSSPKSSKIASGAVLFSVWFSEV